MTWLEFNRKMDTKKTDILRRYTPNYQMDEMEMNQCLDEMIMEIMKYGMEIEICTAPDMYEKDAYNIITCVSDEYETMKDRCIPMDEYLIMIDYWDFKCVSQFDELWYALEDMVFGDEG